ncbi:translation initiation factor IF-2-like [Choloepus didactylus]|uniref:translation initiation factor IF-2-like n=1 Tax=Choloepus didactylus TaxID=27675 RepID=UPI00189F3989|nr:translation initiation factor IF-2-like [Choloepus didactylus]
MSAPRRAPAAPGSGSARAASPPLPAPGRWVPRSRSCYPETAGRKTALAARPSRRGAATAGNKGDKAASAGPGSAPSPLTRPPPRPGRKQPGKPGARPRNARDSAFQPRGNGICQGRGFTPPSWGGGVRAGCSAAVAMTMRTASPWG